MRVGVIGAGASGLVAAINAKNEHNEVVIFERNKECGKKLLVTGAGRCNYFNEDQSLYHYQSSNENLISKVINEQNNDKVIDFFNKLGIIPKIKNGYYYPFSNQAVTIRSALTAELSRKKIKVKTNFMVKNIKVNKDKFVVSSDNEEAILDKLIIATGSCASPKTGSDGMGYTFLEKLGHQIITPLPSLVQLKVKDDDFKIWAGVRTEAKVTLYENGNKLREEHGELQLTNYGLSGICIFNLSNLVSRGLHNNKQEQIFINFLPFLEKDETTWFTKQTKLTNKDIKNLLLSILNQKIVEVILKKSKLQESKLFTELTEEEQNILILYCTKFKTNIISTNSFNEAQVCSGGVKLSEINLETMESKVVKGLYITGEVLDITGDCGGYNLGVAWITGITAGEAAGGNVDD